MRQRGSDETLSLGEIGLLSAPFHCIESCAGPLPESNLCRAHFPQTGKLRCLRGNNNHITSPPAPPPTPSCWPPTSASAASASALPALRRRSDRAAALSPYLLAT